MKTAICEITSISDLRDYLSCQEYWDNITPNIYIYGDTKYQDYVIRELFSRPSSPCIMEITGNDLSCRLDAVISKLTALYEKDYILHKRQNGTVVLLRSAAVKIIYESRRKYAGLLQLLNILYREGEPRQISVLMASNDYPDNFMWYSSRFFVCERLTPNIVNAILHRAATNHCYLNIIEGKPITLRFLLEYFNQKIGKIFKKPHSPKYW